MGASLLQFHQQVDNLLFNCVQVMFSVARQDVSKTC